MNRIDRFATNESGRDFAVGDVHGCFSRLQAALDTVRFNPDVDRLFSVGDLVDRGPESEQVESWLTKPWFHAVRGNHEQMAVDACRADPEGHMKGMHLINGGSWFYACSPVEQAFYSELFAGLPLAIEVWTAAGLIGIVHADCPYDDWNEFVWVIEQGNPVEAAHVAAKAQWSRKRLFEVRSQDVSGVMAVVVGHTPVRQPAVLGNVYHIDTGGWMDGHFTLLNLHTLEAFPPIDPNLSRDWEESS